MKARIGLIAVICAVVALLLYNFVWLNNQSKHDPSVVSKINNRQLKSCKALSVKLGTMRTSLTKLNLSSAQDELVRMNLDIVSCVGRQNGLDGGDVTTDEVRYLQERLKSLQSYVDEVVSSGTSVNK